MISALFLITQWLADGKTHYAYDTSSDRVYVLETDVTDAEGRKQYRVDGFTDGQPVLQMGFQIIYRSK